MILAQWLRRLRKRRRWTQIQLANDSGISARTIGDIESGAQKRPHASTLDALFDTFDIDSVERSALVRAFYTDPDEAGSHRELFPDNTRDLIGRADEIERISRFMCDSDVRVLTITGAAGIGKTSVAIAVVRDLARDFVGGITFVDLSAVDDWRRVVPVMLEALGGSRDHERLVVPPRAATLIFVDNFEHVIEASRTFSQFVASASYARFLVTSREPLDIGPEITVQLEPLSHEASAELFTAVAQRSRPDLTFSAADDEDIATICTRLDFNPLAITLAAGRLQLASLTWLTRETRRPLAVLTGGARDAPLRHQSMVAAIFASYRLLDPDERLALLALSVFRNGATVDAVAHCLDWTPASTAAIVESLARKSLVYAASREDGESAINLLHTIRDFARSYWNGVPSEQLSRLRLRHAGYFRERAAQLRATIYGPEHAWAWRALKSDRENAREAVAFALDHDQAGIGLRIVLDSLYLFAEDEGVEEPLALIDALRPTLSSSEPELELLQVRAHQSIAYFCFLSGDFDRGEREIAQGWALAQALGPARLAFYYDTSIILAGASGKYSEGVAAAHASLAIRRTLGEPLLLAATLANAIKVTLYAGNVEDAGALVEEMLGILRSATDSHGTGGMLASVSEFFFYSGDLSRANEIALRAEAVTPPDQISVAMMLQCTLGDIAAASGEQQLAVRRYGRAIQGAASAWDFPSRYALVIYFIRIVPSLENVAKHELAARAARLAADLESLWSITVLEIDRRPLDGRYARSRNWKTKTEISRDLMAFQRDLRETIATFDPVSSKNEMSSENVRATPISFVNK